MNFKNFNLTPSSKKALQKAKTTAKKFGHLKVIDFHLLHAISEQSHTNLDYIYHRIGFSKEGLISGIEAVLKIYKEPKRKKEIYCPSIKVILQSAEVIAKKYKSDYIGVDHILWAILEKCESIYLFIEKGGVDPEKLQSSLVFVFENGVNSEMSPTSPRGEPTAKHSKQMKSLDECCENLNEKCREKDGPEIFGRDKEIERLYEILLKRNKCNAILVGDAGTGKTAIVEGLAERIVGRQCPDLLLNKEIYYLDVTNILSGTIFRGQMEEKIKTIIDMVKSQSNIILFIDEIHTIIGAGGSEGGLDIANILKPALSRGEISCIGATTKQEYEKFFKKDSALNRRFEKIDVNEPSKEETLNLLINSKKHYETFHMVEYTEEALKLIVDLCDEYFPNKKFPDKAFDILDESGSKTKIKSIVRPEKAIELERQLLDEDIQDNIEEFTKIQKKYLSILKRWGQKLEKAKFSVDVNTIYSIFADKLETSIEKIKNNETIPTAGKIGF
jgi:ATP-dependent Clp protease ATP-binding subunit ClpC